MSNQIKSFFGLSVIVVFIFSITIFAQTHQNTGDKHQHKMNTECCKEKHNEVASKECCQNKIESKNNSMECCKGKKESKECCKDNMKSKENSHECANNKKHENKTSLEEMDKNKDGKLFQCSMCPDQISDEAGNCKECGMELKEVKIEDLKKQQNKK